MRLQVYLSHNGVCSRRKAMELIQHGRVHVNRQIVKEPSWAVDPDKDQVMVDGKRVQAKKYEYVLLNKPEGYVTTTTDKHRESTVMELLPPTLRHLSPVGRLDKNTEGLLLLTNDGDVAFQLTHPKFNVDKTYYVKIDGLLKPEQKLKLEKGIYIQTNNETDEPSYATAPAKIERFKPIGGGSEFTITIHEGHKRQIRLMLLAVGHKVIYLKRLQQGPIELGTLRRGSWRFMAPQEIGLLKKVQTGIRVKY